MGYPSGSDACPTQNRIFEETRRSILDHIPIVQHNSVCSPYDHPLPYLFSFILMELLCASVYHTYCLQSPLVSFCPYLQMDFW